MKNKKAAITVLVAAVLALLVLVLRSSPANYWITPGELQGRGKAEVPVRVAGKVVLKSMKWDQVNNRILFKIRAGGEKVTLPVVYRGFAPDSLQDLSDVIVEGSMNGQTLEAENILVRCPENYLPEKAAVAASKVLRIEGTLYR